MNEYHVCGVLLMSRPEHSARVEHALSAIPGVELHANDGGRMVVVEGHGNAAAAWLYVRDGDVVSRRRGFNCAVKSLPGFSREAEFVF